MNRATHTTQWYGSHPASECFPLPKSDIALATDEKRKAKGETLETPVAPEKRRSRWRIVESAVEMQIILSIHLTSATTNPPLWFSVAL